MAANVSKNKLPNVGNIWFCKELIPTQLYHIALIMPTCFKTSVIPLLGTSVFPKLIISRKACA